MSASFWAPWGSLVGLSPQGAAQPAVGSPPPCGACSGGPTTAKPRRSTPARCLSTESAATSSAMCKTKVGLMIQTVCVGFEIILRANSTIISTFT